MCEISYPRDIHYNLHFNLREVCVEISVRKFEKTKMKDLDKKLYSLEESKLSTWEEKKDEETT